MYDFVAAGEVTYGADSFDYEVTPNFTLTFTVDDGYNSSSLSLLVLIRDVNEAPTIDAVLDLGPLYENETLQRVVADVDATDVDGDILTYSIIVSRPDSYSFIISASGRCYDKLVCKNLIVKRTCPGLQS